jgi:uncharacterized protein (TIGR02246 family)
MHATLLHTSTLLAVLAIAPIAAPAPAADPAPADERSAAELAAGSLWAALDAAWNARDAEQFSQIFADDASLRFVDRDLSLDGRAAIRRYFTEQFGRQAADLRHESTQRAVRLVAPNVLGVDADIAILRVGATDASQATIVRNFEIFALMHRSDGGLRFQVLRAYRLRDGT